MIEPAGRATCGRRTEQSAPHAPAVYNISEIISRHDMDGHNELRFAAGDY